MAPKHNPPLSAYARYLPSLATLVACSPGRVCNPPSAHVTCNSPGDIIPSPVEKWPALLKLLTLRMAQNLSKSEIADTPGYKIPPVAPLWVKKASIQTATGFACNKLFSNHLPIWWMIQPEFSTPKLVAVPHQSCNSARACRRILWRSSSRGASSGNLWRPRNRLRICNQLLSAFRSKKTKQKKSKQNVVPFCEFLETDLSFFSFTFFTFERRTWWHHFRTSGVHTARGQEGRHQRAVGVVLGAIDAHWRLE